MGTAVENEFKFTTDQRLNAADTIESLETFLRDRGIPYNKKSRQSTDTYYDSKDLVLFRRGCILRQKNSSNGRIKLTAKKPISDAEEMMSREETEVLSDGTFESLEAFGKECFPDLTIEKDPVLTIETERTAIYYIDGSVIMLSFDTCRYVSGRDSKRFLEIEIESMGNTTKRDFDLIGMRDFTKQLAFFPVTKSKYQRGIEWIQSLNAQI